MPGQVTAASTLAPGCHEGDGERLRLAEFIRDNVDTIVAEWEAFASTLAPASDTMSPLQLRNHIRQMLAFLIQDMESRQSSGEEREKALGMAAKSQEVTASELHAALRVAGGFDIKQMVAEFRALRASIMRLWGRKTATATPDLGDVMRFNESIDQMISETVSYYTDTVSKTRDLFVGIVGHDLRNPLQAVMGCVELLPLIGSLTDAQKLLCRQAATSSQRMVEILNYLVDLTRARFGVGLKIIRAPMDAAFVVHQIVQEMRVSHPYSRIEVDATGRFEVEWDKGRFGQLVSNLLGNAIQYGFRGTRISVVLDATSDATVTLTVHNLGLPIPADKMPTLFDPLTRGGTADGATARGSNLGLGLFIVNDIVVAHGGKLSLTSTEEGGTTFTTTLPRNAAVAAREIRPGH
jgi:signal transduction histidine kinase